MMALVVSAVAAWKYGCWQWVTFAAAFNYYSEFVGSGRAPASAPIITTVALTSMTSLGGLSR